MGTPNAMLGQLTGGGNLGRYGMALTFILYLLYNETTRNDPSWIRAAIFIAICLLVILAKYLAVAKGVKDDEPKSP